MAVYRGHRGQVWGCGGVGAGMYVWLFTALTMDAVRAARAPLPDSE